MTASATGNERERHYSSQIDLAAGGLQLAGKKRCRDNEGLPKGIAEDEEDGPGNLRDSIILSKAMEDDIQQLRQRMSFFTSQVHFNILALKFDSRTTHNLFLSRLSCELCRLKRVMIQDNRAVISP